MSSAYSSASQIANLRDKAVAKSVDPSNRKTVNESHNNSNPNISNGQMKFNPKQEYFGHQLTKKDKNKKGKTNISVS